MASRVQTLLIHRDARRVRRRRFATFWWVNFLTRAVLALGIITLSNACGGSPASPGNSNTTGISTVRAGDYLVTVSAASFSSGTQSVCFVLSGGSAAIPDFATFTVTVTSDSGTFTMRPTGASNLGMVAVLKGASGMITGPVSGQARDTDSGAIVTFSQLAPNTFPGAGSADPTLVGFNPTDPDTFSGPVTGALSFASSAGSAYVCGGGSWRMRPK